MLALTGATRLFLYRGAADMRKSFDGLSGLVRTELGGDPLSGDLFVFCNRRRTMVKLLYWDRDGLALWYKRLERGTFRLPAPGRGAVEIDRRSLMLLLEGVTPRRLNRRYALAQGATGTP
ncbi:MAG: IS66 family insertion sequence element accessory protein TnpB [Candidatus Latescibacterota bacterium]